MSKLPRFVTITGWRHGRSTIKHPHSYRLELDNEWLTEPVMLPGKNDDKYNELIGKEYSLLQIIMGFGDRFEVI